MNTLVKENLNKELVFQNIEQKSFKDINAPKITIKHSVIRNCDFFNVDMKNCDFISSKIYNVSFKNVSFSCADIFSLWFSECRFENVNFSGAGIEDITFSNCYFDNCTFDDVGLKSCLFSDSHFVNIEPTSSSFVLNQYNHCIFQQCYFSGSFQYQIFDNCKFEDVRIEYSILKYNFGIGFKNGIKYLKNGLLLKEVNNLYDLLVDECRRQNLFLNAAFVDFNFAPSINPELVLESMDAIELMLSKEILIRKDELLFLRRLYQYMYERHMIAPIIIFQLLAKIKDIKLSMNTNIAYSKSNETFTLIYNDLYFQFCKFYDNLQEMCLTSPQSESPLNIYIDYEQEPTMSLVDLLNKCLPNTCKRISSRYGSFHEIIAMLPQGVELLNIFLQILGICVPIVYSEIKEKKQKLNSESEKQKPNSELEKSINFNISTKSNTKYSVKAIKQLCHNLVATGLLNENLQGYNNTNIKHIEIKYVVNIQL